MSTLLKITDLNVHYGHGRQLLKASDGVTLSVAKGETVGLVGESGSGKSTIGRAIVGLAPVTSGSVCFDGTEIGQASRSQRRRLSADIQMVFQDPFSSLNPARTIGQTLVEPLLVHHASMGEAQRSARITEMLAKVELPAEAAQRYPAQFSGGQRQRIAIARALMLSPQLVICDEPVSALDLSIQAQVLNLLADLRDEFGVAYLFIAHDLAVVRHLAHRTIVLYSGQIMESGPAAAVNDDPKHPYSQALVAAAPVPDPEIQRARSIQRSESTSTLTSTNQLRTPDPINACPFASRCTSAMDRCWRERPQLTDVGQDRTVACFLY